MEANVTEGGKQDAGKQEGAQKFENHHHAKRKKRKPKKDVDMTCPMKILESVLSTASYQLPNLSQEIEKKFYQTPDYSQELARLLEDVVYLPTVGEINENKSDVSISVFPTIFDGHVNVPPSAIMSLSCINEEPKKRQKWRRGGKGKGKGGGGNNNNQNKTRTPAQAFNVLPATSFDFDEWKRRISNNPPEDYLPYFWEKFDAENCSIWLCDYKYNPELGSVFMSSNLVRGFCNRLDKAQKLSFGSMAVFGEDHNNMVAGLWVWRGQDLMFKLYEDWQVDYESYHWRKLEPDSNETKRYVELFFKQEEGSVYTGKKLVYGKFFK